MAEITLHGTPVKTIGDLPDIGSVAPDFNLVDINLEAVALGTFPDKKKLISIIPSIDTPVCADTSGMFIHSAKERPSDIFLIISSDLPFAHSRFHQQNEPGDNFKLLSTIRTRQFSKDYGVLITDGALAGLCARAILVLDTNNKIVYTELVPEIGDKPDCDAALRALDELD